MGGQESKSKLFTECSQLFSEEERKQIGVIYSRICDNNTDGFSEADLMKYGQAYLTETLLKNLFFYMKSVVVHSPGDMSSDLLVSEEEFLVSLAFILKGTTEQRTLFLIYLTNGTGQSPVQASALKQTIAHLLESYIKCYGGGPAISSWKFSLSDDTHSSQLLTLVLHDLVYKGMKRQCDVETSSFPWDSAHTPDAIESWLSRSAVLLSLIDTIFHKMFSISAVDSMIHQSHLIPHCCHAPWGKLKTLLDFSAVLFLNQSIPQELQNEWRFLFSTSVHGESFSAMMNNIVGKGPTVILVEDTQGHIFGGFATDSWKMTSQFIGGPRCFLFSLSPLMDSYQVTGCNDHYQYLNHGQETIPNGLGMGGQFEYFGLWLDAEFGKGQSKAEPRCTTFNSPQLSRDTEFSIQRLEVWGLGPEPRKGEDGEGEASSILDKDPEAKAMLSLLDRGPVSDGLREDDPMADIPEEHTLQR